MPESSSRSISSVAGVFSVRLAMLSTQPCASVRELRWCAVLCLTGAEDVDEDAIWMPLLAVSGLGLSTALL